MGTAALRQSHASDLEAWSGSRQVVLEAPPEEKPLPVAGHDEELVARVEGLLAEARTAGYGAEPAAAEQALANAELLLRGNPELPQAAWLMSETCAEHGALVKNTDPALAGILLRRARVLGGARATAFAQSAGTESGPAAPAEVSLEGPQPIDEVYLDGARVTLPATISAEEHHLRVERRGRLAWAGWLTPEGDAVRVPVPPVTACSLTDVEGARIAGERVEIDGPVLCPEWAIARDAGVERVEVAVCRPTGCGAFLPWSRAWGRSFDLPTPQQHPQSPAEHKGGNTVLWAAVGVGAAVLAGSLVLWQAGAFESEGATRTTFRITGPGAQ
jgi:hypothetical protein